LRHVSACIFSGARKGRKQSRAESLEELNEFLADEPYCKATVMRFSKITEFNPVQHQPILNDWFEKP
jgi:hypothetical protein